MKFKKINANVVWDVLALTMTVGLWFVGKKKDENTWEKKIDERIDKKLGNKRKGS